MFVLGVLSKHFGTLSACHPQSDLISDCGDRQQGVVDLFPISRPGPMSQELLYGDPVVQDSATALLLAPAVAQLQDGGGFLLVC